METYYAKVAKIAQVKYELDSDVLKNYMYEIDECYKNGYSPIRTVEVLSDLIFK